MYIFSCSNNKSKEMKGREGEREKEVKREKGRKRRELFLYHFDGNKYFSHYLKGKKLFLSFSFLLFLLLSIFFFLVIFPLFVVKITSFCFPPHKLEEYFFIHSLFSREMNPYSLSLSLYICCHRERDGEFISLE